MRDDFIIIIIIITIIIIACYGTGMHKDCAHMEEEQAAAVTFA